MWTRTWDHKNRGFIPTNVRKRWGSNWATCTYLRLWVILPLHCQPNSENSINMQTSLDWQHVSPQGMEKIVTYVKDRYNNTPMFITENGKHISVSLLTNAVSTLSCLTKMFCRVWRIGQPKFHWGAIPWWFRQKKLHGWSFRCPTGSNKVRASEWKSR